MPAQATNSKLMSVLGFSLFLELCPLLRESLDADAAAMCGASVRLGVHLTDPESAE